MKNITHLVFSGGGCRSFCLLGILRYLYIEHIHNNIHNVAGASMGSFFCLLFALKMPYEKIEEIIKDIIVDETAMKIYSKSFVELISKNGIGSILTWFKLVKKYIKDTYDVDDLTFMELSKKTGVNLYVSSTNINTLTNTIFSIDTTPDVSIIQAVASSMTVPYLSYPIEINGEYYIDGALTNNFPIKVFKNIPKENILGVAIKIDNDYKINAVPKNTQLSLYTYTYQMMYLIYLNSFHHTLFDHLNNDILIIDKSPIDSFLNLEFKKEYIELIITIEDIDELIIKGFIDINNHMKKYV